MNRLKLLSKNNFKSNKIIRKIIQELLELIDIIWDIFKGI